MQILEKEITTVLVKLTYATIIVRGIIRQASNFSRKGNYIQKTSKAICYIEKKIITLKL